MFMCLTIKPLMTAQCYRTRNVKSPYCAMFVLLSATQSMNQWPPTGNILNGELQKKKNRYVIMKQKNSTRENHLFFFAC